MSEKSPKFEKVKAYFDKGLWSAKRVDNAVAKGWITREEYAEITATKTTAR